MAINDSFQSSATRTAAAPPFWAFHAFCVCVCARASQSIRRNYKHASEGSQSKAAWTGTGSRKALSKKGLCVGSHELHLVVRVVLVELHK